ncbi:hypothetical protein KPL70_004184 [Citrus sinensis]|nr:hypothetical protein KPL70_004184 [Citrus sinensis]
MPFASYLCSSCISFFFILVRLLNGCFGGDPYVFYDWTISFITASPLGDKQQVIGINGQFPGPILNVTTNWNVVVNAKNDLDEPLLLTCDWYTKSHKKLRKDVENGVDLGVPDGILINGLGPYRYDAAIVPDSIPYQDQAQRIYSSGAPSVVDASRTVLLAFVMALFGYLISREMSWMVVNVETEKMVSCYEDEVGFKIPSEI